MIAYVGKGHGNTSKLYISTLNPDSLIYKTFSGENVMCYDTFFSTEHLKKAINGYSIKANSILLDQAKTENV